MTPPDFSSLSDDEFRGKAREFFAQHYPSHLRFILRRARLAEMMEWYSILYTHGWVAPSWPREYGGMGLDTGKMLILLEEQEQYGVTRVPDHGIVQVGPIIMKYGSTEQKKYYLPKILSGEHIWGQGYSEPNAGSDLASLATSAVPDGTDFIVNGQKIWTTLAHDSTHLYTLVRTSKEGKKQEGISFLLIDAKAPGITIRPIRNIAGHEEFCEVFFENVRVPQANLVGGLNKGWTVAKALLSFERINIGSPRRPQYALKRLEQLARAKGLFDDPGFADKFTALKLDLDDLGSLYARYVEIVKRGEELGLRRGEELGLHRGQALGEEIGLRRAILTNLETRFGPVPPQVASLVAGIAQPDALTDLIRTSLRVRDLAAFVTEVGVFGRPPGGPASG